MNGNKTGLNCVWKRLIIPETAFRLGKKRLRQIERPIKRSKKD